MNIDLTRIEGYEAMSPEEKVAALERYVMPDPDYSGYVKKSVFDKTATDLADVKKKLRDKMTTDEAAEQANAEAMEALKSERDELKGTLAKVLKQNAIAESKAKLMGMGYDEKLAFEAATALSDGNSEGILSAVKKHIDILNKANKVNDYKNSTRPEGDGEGKAMTKEKLQGMSSLERLEFSRQHPEEYKEIYNGGK